MNRKRLFVAWFELGETISDIRILLCSEDVSRNLKRHLEVKRNPCEFCGKLAKDICPNESPRLSREGKRITESN